MNLEGSLTLLQIAAVMFVLLRTIRLVQRGNGSTAPVLFAFAMACALLSDFYWLAYDILRPDTRMPFAANEIGEWALFLLLGASLNADQPEKQPFSRKETAGAALFAASSTALWIGWSGEWVQDILTGFAFGYFLCCAASHAARSKAYPAGLRRLLRAACPVLIASQAALFFVPDPLKKPLDLFCYALMFTVMAVLFVFAVRAIRIGASRDKAVSLSFSLFAWITTTMYMSAGRFYDAAVAVMSLCLVLMLLSIEREAVS
ncbi:MAG: hypothetical protein K5981_01260 [Clostridia bacterium]|nr:hypothetical protein [Clostridia bacterium]